MKDDLSNTKLYVFFARYHISDLRAVMEGIKASGMSDRFFIENPGKREDGTVAENSFTIYTDLVPANADERVKRYVNYELREKLGLLITIKV
jgi:hypothetical protein